MKREKEEGEGQSRREAMRKCQGLEGRGKEWMGPEM